MGGSLGHTFTHEAEIRARARILPWLRVPPLGHTQQKGSTILIDLNIAAGADTAGWQHFEYFYGQSDGGFLSVRRREEVDRLTEHILVRVPVGFPVPHVSRLLRSLANELEFKLASTGTSPIDA